MSVNRLAKLTGVTATAVRQRLNRLMEKGLIQRVLSRAGRGRPSYRYELTEKGLRQTGANFADLCIALWEEVRLISDPEVRQGLVRRLAARMAAKYSDDVHGLTKLDRMRSLSELLSKREIPLSVDESGDLPVLQAEFCPYPDLAEADREICSLERLMYEELIGEDLRLTGCRLDGAECCTFQTK